MIRKKVSLSTSRRALIQILCADIIWGLGFVMAQWTLYAWSPLISSAVRLGVAFAVCLIFFACRRELYWFEARRAMFPGMINGGVLLFQTWGLLYTDVTKVGFITTLYIVFVPLMERVFFKRRLHPWHWFWVLLALAGTLVISGATFDNFNRGDALTLICSLCAAVHILSLEGLEANISPVRFNMWQCAWATLVAIVAALIFERGNAVWPSTNFADPNITKAFMGMACLIFLSSIVAFSIQAEAQRHLAPSVAGLLYLGECIFGALFAYFLVGERLSAFQWSGAGLILVAALGVIRLETRALNVKPV